jgi:hypothetical protein
MITEQPISSGPRTAPPGSVPVEVPAAPATPEKVGHIAVYGHSNLVYWWPVWLISFVLAGVTYVEADPAVTGSSLPGAVFVSTLLAVALSSTVVLRGMVSLVGSVVMVALVATFAWFGWWDNIFAYLGGLDIRINTAGYLCIGVPLFVAWAAVVFVYDRQHYVIFDSGQIRYVEEAGDSQMAVQAEGATVEKRRSDAFRHWVLGLGAGDLVVRAGTHGGRAIYLDNVLNIRRKMAVIDRMLREKAVTVG